MNRFAFAFLLVLGLMAPALAKDLYYTQGGGGTGSSCASPYSLSQLNAWTNVASGDTLHLCSVFTTSANSGLIYVGGSGTAGNPITIKFETGAKCSSPYFSDNGCIYMSGKSYIVVDGGTNGIIENTANGTSLANHVQDSSAIRVLSGNQIEIKNLTCRNMYVRTSTTDHNLGGGPATNNCFRFDGGSNISVHNNVLHDAAWTVWYGAATGAASNFSMHGNELYNFDHGLGFGEGGADSKTFDGISIHDNHFHDPSPAWDDTASPSGQWYHHDGIHLFMICSGGSWCSSTTASNISIYNNLFDGVWSQVSGGYQVGLTGHIFTEGLLTALSYFNNVSLTSGTSDQYSNNGVVNIGATNLLVYNNTIIGANAAAGSCLVPRDQGGTSAVKNNVVANCQVLNDVQGGGLNGGIDYNVYAAPGNQGWKWSGSAQTNFPTWQSSHGETHSHSYSTVGNLGLSTGVPQAGSAVIGAAVSLSGLGISALNSGINGVARGSNWDAGAYEYSAGGTPPTITTTSLPGGTVGVAYSQIVDTTQGPTCRVSAGSLPAGLSLSSCTVSGIPTTAGTSNFTITASNGTSPDAMQSLSIAIGAAPSAKVQFLGKMGAGGNIGAQ